MIETVNEWRFIDAFMNIRPDNFTRSGLQALYDYFICCEFTQYKDLKEINEAYGHDFEDLEALSEYTQVIDFDDGIIIQDY